MAISIPKKLKDEKKLIDKAKSQKELKKKLYEEKE